MRPSMGTFCTINKVGFVLDCVFFGLAAAIVLGVCLLSADLCSGVGVGEDGGDDGDAGAGGRCAGVDGCCCC